LIHSSLLCPGTLPWDDVAAIWHSQCFIFRPAASPASRLRLPKAVEDRHRHCWNWNRRRIANRLHLIHRLDIVVWSLFKADPATVICSGHRPDIQTRLFFHSLLRSPLTSAGLTRPSHPTSLRDPICFLRHLFFNTLYYITLHCTGINWQANLSLPLLTKKPLRPAE